MKILINSIFVLLVLTACASNVPLTIRQSPVTNPNINEVRTDLDVHKGQKVRWGGTISTIENKVSDTWLEIVGRKLGAYGRPYANDKSLGRFLVRIDGFLDPDIYEVDREVTIYGVVESRIARQIDEHPYIYPLVKAEEFYLWPVYTYQRYGYRDYDPYYYPYYYPYSYRYRFYPYFGLRYGHLHDYRLRLSHYYYR